MEMAVSAAYDGDKSQKGDSYVSQQFIFSKKRIACRQCGFLRKWHCCPVVFKSNCQLPWWNCAMVRSRIWRCSHCLWHSNLSGCADKADQHRCRQIRSLWQSRRIHRGGAAGLCKPCPFHNCRQMDDCHHCRHRVDLCDISVAWITEISKVIPAGREIIRNKKGPLWKPC